MNYIIFDLEATCFKSNAPNNFIQEIIEIGAVKVSESGEVIDEYQTFVRPWKFPKLSDFCKELTSITQSDVDQAKYFPEIISGFIEWCGKDAKFVSWGHYDRKQLWLDCDLHKANNDWITENNHMSLKHLHGKWNNLNSPRGVGLGRACKFEKIVFEGVKHRGIDDARNIAKIFVKYLDRIKS